MKSQRLVAAVVFLLTLHFSAQSTYTADKAKGHIGENAIICALLRVPILQPPAKVTPSYYDSEAKFGDQNGNTTGRTFASRTRFKSTVALPRSLRAARHRCRPNSERSRVLRFDHQPLDCHAAFLLGCRAPNAPVRGHWCGKPYPHNYQSGVTTVTATTLLVTYTLPFSMCGGTCMDMDNDKRVPLVGDKTQKKGKRILSVALAAAGLLASASSALGSVVSAPIEKAKTIVEMSAGNSQRTLPGPLVLKTANSMQQLAMQHESHVSHSSHESHSSHVSHSSGS